MEHLHVRACYLSILFIGLQYVTCPPSPARVRLRACPRANGAYLCEDKVPVYRARKD